MSESRTDEVNRDEYEARPPGYFLYSHFWILSFKACLFRVKWFTRQEIQCLILTTFYFLVPCVHFGEKFETCICRLGLGARVIPKATPLASNDRAGRVLLGKLNAQKRQTLKNAEKLDITKKIEASDDDDEDERESRTFSFSKKRATPPATSFSSSKRNKWSLLRSTFCMIRASCFLNLKSSWIPENHDMFWALFTKLEGRHYLIHPSF